MSASTNLAEATMLGYLLTTTNVASLPLSRPTAWWVGLFTAAPSDTGGGTEVSTAGGSNYSRQSATFTVATDGSGVTTAKNTGILTFGTASGAGTNWGTITHLGIFTASTSGNLLFWGNVTVPKTIEISDQFVINANSLIITLD